MHTIARTLTALLALGAMSGGALAQAGLFADPVRLEADGEAIDIGTLYSVAHAGPTLGDLDGDGDRDLLVGSFSGTFFHFENIGSEAAPRYAYRGELQAGGEAAKTPIY